MYRLVDAGMSSIDPTTGTPSMERPCALASSSNTATGTSPAPGLRSISRMAAAPASRLPTIATLKPTLREPRCQANRREWKRSRPIPAVVNMQPTTMTITGTASNLARCPSGYRATRTQATTVADSTSWRASSAPA